MISAKEQLEVIKKGTSDLLPEAELLEKLKTGKPLRVKLGADPSSPDLHLGHYVALRKLKQLQDLGHQIVFLIGDFTGMIGDPTGRSATRPALTRDEVVKNAETYEEQVFRVLDRSKTEIRFNSEWMDKMNAADVVKLCASATVARMLERDDFSARYKDEKPIGIHEFLYPLVQAYDSVALDADLEVGGTDQRFNLLMGREVQRSAGQNPQAILCMPLLEGLDGVAKMSKSLNNAIGISEPPEEMFGKLMSLSDEIMPRYAELLTDLDWPEIAKRIEAGALHPMDAKKQLAESIVGEMHDDSGAAAGRAAFESRFQRREVPKDLPELRVVAAEEISLPQVMVEAGMAKSGGEGRRLIGQGAVRIEGEKVGDLTYRLGGAKELLLEVGRRRACRLVFD